MAERRGVTVYTDGACLGNPGPGGYGIVLLYGDSRKEMSGGFRKTTNNRMELMGPIISLEALMEPCRVTLYSDSQYVVNGVSKGWAKKWRANGWRRVGGAPAINPDLWGRLLDLCERHEVRFRWVRGHSNNVENNRVDGLAVDAAKGPSLAVDDGYAGKGRRR